MSSTDHPPYSSVSTNIPHLEPNIEGISHFLDSLPRIILTSAPPTHFPVQLPLAFPTALHHLNFITCLHIIHSVLSHPRHSSYFFQSRTTPHETAIRGVMGAFLASDESWGSDNLLGASAWSSGKMSEEKISDIFGIEVMREQDHETMKGVKVGGRWQPGVMLVGDLMGLFKRVAGAVKSRGGRCIGDAAVSALKAAGEEVEGMKGEKGHEYARVFCDKALHFEKSLADPYPVPSGKIIPAAPLRLLQDLSHFPKLSELGITTPIPRSHDLSNLSPLPIPISFILLADLVDLSDLPSDIQSSLSSGTDIDGSRHLLDLTRRDDSSAPARESIEVASPQVYAALQTVSVEICREIWGSARFSSDRDPGAEWKREMSLLDVYKVCTALEGLRGGKGVGKEVVLALSPTST